MNPKQKKNTTEEFGKMTNTNHMNVNLEMVMFVFL